MTTELLLIISRTALAILSLICYVLYYGLDSRAGYVDGMIPLILAAAYMMVLAAFIARAGSV